MKNLEKANLLIKLKHFLKENNLNLTACGCCGGVHVEYNDDELLESTDCLKDIDGDIKHYQENQNKIFIKDLNDYRFTKIEMIKVDGKIINLGGRSTPFNKFYNKRFQRFDDIDWSNL